MLWYNTSVTYVNVFFQKILWIAHLSIKKWQSEIAIHWVRYDNWTFLICFFSFWNYYFKWNYLNLTSHTTMIQNFNNIRKIIRIFLLSLNEIFYAIIILVVELSTTPSVNKKWIKYRLTTIFYCCATIDDTDIITLIKINKIKKIVILSDNA